MKRSSIRRRKIILWLLSLLVVLSMVCSLVGALLTRRSRPSPTPAPTRVIPTWTPTATETPPSPQAPAPSPLEPPQKQDS